MGKLNIHISLMKVYKAFSYKITGKSGEVKECICIPKEYLDTDRNGNVWLNITAFPDNKWEKQTHSLKQSFSREQYNALPVDENGRKIRTLYLGTITSDETQENGTNRQNSSSEDECSF